MLRQRTTQTENAAPLEPGAEVTQPLAERGAPVPHGRGDSGALPDDTLSRPEPPHSHRDEESNLSSVP